MKWLTGVDPEPHGSRRQEGAGIDHKQWVPTEVFEDQRTNVWLNHISLIANHVDEGRGRLNFSAWDQPNEDFDEMEKAINQGQMPLWDYLLLHPEAKLSDAEKQALIAGLKATLAADPPIARAETGPPR